MRIAVLSPHRDDAAFSLGLAVGAWLEQGHAVEVVDCFTRSEFAPYSDVGMVHANDRMSYVSGVGRRENEEWRKRYGVAKLTLTDLNLKDAPLRLHCAADEVFGREADRSEKVAGKIRLALERGRAEALVLPLGLGGHVDHVTVREMGAAGRVEAMPVAFYEDLPFGGVSEEIEGAVGALGLKLEAMFVGGAGRDVEAAVARKRRLAVCYDSQIDEATATEIAEFSRRYEGRERLWGNAAWMAAFG